MNDEPQPGGEWTHEALHLSQPQRVWSRRQPHHWQSLVISLASWPGASMKNVMTKKGQPYNNKYCFIFRLANGRLKEVAEYVDTELVTATIDI